MLLTFEAAAALLAAGPRPSKRLRAVYATCVDVYYTSAHSSTHINTHKQMYLYTFLNLLLNHEMTYQVFLVSCAGAPRDHQAIFVETNSDKSGQIFQVTGNIQTGMRYESKPAKRPEESLSFVKKELLGTVTTANYTGIDPACRRNPPPANVKS
jgi:hypothetical protein